MNITEKKAYNWILTQGKEAIFQRRKSPDFICKDGSAYEVKLIRNNVITFSRAQFESLKDSPGNLDILAFDGGIHPVIIPFNEIRDKAYLGHIRVVVYNTDEYILEISVDGAGKLALEKKAKKMGLTLASYCRMILLREAK